MPEPLQNGHTFIPQYPSVSISRCFCSALCCGRQAIVQGADRRMDIHRSHSRSKGPKRRSSWVDEHPSAQTSRIATMPLDSTLNNYISPPYLICRGHAAISSCGSFLFDVGLKVRQNGVPVTKTANLGHQVVNLGWKRMGMEERGCRLHGQGLAPRLDRRLNHFSKRS